MHGTEKDVRNIVSQSDRTALFFSDQEPPYSMITLHEMAETGKEKMKTPILTLRINLSDHAVSTYHMM